MKIFTLIIFLLFSQLFLAPISYADTTTDIENNSLQQRFIKKHQAIVPVVAVADMFFACNRQRHTDSYDYQIADLVNKMDKNQLAEKLSDCLAGESLKSDIALNFGLIGCFHAQMASLNQKKYDEKMGQLELLLVKLPREQRQKTFTKCVSEQALYFVK
jgi:hypothetical protein